MSPNEKATRRSPPVIIDGYSESAWKSLVVKALRIGWPEELRQAASRLAPGKVQGVLLASVFEDIFPAESELADVLGEVRRGDWGALCAREIVGLGGFAQRHEATTSTDCDLYDFHRGQRRVRVEFDPPLRDTNQRKLARFLFAISAATLGARLHRPTISRVDVAVKLRRGGKQ